MSDSIINKSRVECCYLRAQSLICSEFRGIIKMQINPPKKESPKVKVDAPLRTTVEQVYIKRLQEQQAFLTKDEYRRRH